LIVGIPKRRLRVKTGFPPKVMTASPESTLSDLGFASREAILIEEAPPIMEHNPMVRRSVPADNSCLFSSISYCLEKEVSGAKKLRELTASLIASDPKNYNKVVLGESNESYTKRLLNSGTWGSAIEIAILSEHFNIEIVIALIQTCDFQYFGVDKKYKERIFLIYDGIHYDPVVKNELGKSK
jgi:ubiquitin thioesterase OTU1